MRSTLKLIQLLLEYGSLEGTYTAWNVDPLSIYTSAFMSRFKKNSMRRTILALLPLGSINIVSKF